MLMLICSILKILNFIVSVYKFFLFFSPYFIIFIGSPFLRKSQHRLPSFMFLFVHVVFYDLIFSKLIFLIEDVFCSYLHTYIHTCTCIFSTFLFYRFYSDVDLICIRVEACKLFICNFNLSLLFSKMKP